MKIPFLAKETGTREFPGLFLRVRPAWIDLNLRYLAAQLEFPPFSGARGRKFARNGAGDQLPLSHRSRSDDRNHPVLKGLN